VQKIKPRVEQVCRDMGLDYATEENEGRIYVDLKGGRVNAPPPLPAQPSGYQGGYHSQPQYQPPQQGGGNQQHHQQQQQQGTGDDEIEQLAKKFLPQIIRELKACCVVM
jgi:hypothetical protein